MNKELEEAINNVICEVICDKFELSHSKKAELHRKILSAVWDYLQEKSTNTEKEKAYAASLRLQETPSKPQETFSARNAKAVVSKARTYEGFLRNALEDIEGLAKYGKDILTILATDGSGVANYFTRLTADLRAAGFEVNRKETVIKRQSVEQIRIRLVIRW